MQLVAILIREDVEIVPNKALCGCLSPSLSLSREGKRNGEVGGRGQEKEGGGGLRREKEEGGRRKGRQEGREGGGNERKERLKMEEGRGEGE